MSRTRRTVLDEMRVARVLAQAGWQLQAVITDNGSEVRSRVFEQLAGDPRVAPTRVLACEPQHELAHPIVNGRTAGTPGSASQIDF